MHILYSLIAIALGAFVEVYMFAIVRMVGHMDWAEKYLGAGGTYTAWRLLGIVLILGGFWGFGHSL